jgi:hypothetical protein
MKVSRVISIGSGMRGLVCTLIAESVGINSQRIYPTLAILGGLDNMCPVFRTSMIFYIERVSSLKT